MKQRYLIIIIIIISIFSGGAGAFITIKYSQNFYKKINTNNVTGIQKERDSNINQTYKIINITNLENEVTSLVSSLSSGVVSIVIKKDLVLFKSDPWGFFNTPIGTIKRKVGGGTGFFIKKDGTIITNKHVISDPDAEYSVLTNSGKEYLAKVLAVDTLTDLAIIKINSSDEFETIDLIEDENNIKIGQFGIAIGNALAEFQNSISLGVISGKNRSIEVENGYKLNGLLQTDAAINPGNSGGPLVNLNGEVIGINTAIVSNSNGVGFSIPLSKRKIDYMLESIEKYSEIKKPFIGINYLILYDGIMQELGVNVNYGAYILDKKGSIVVGSQAEKVGLEGGDIILEVDKVKINLSNDLNSIIQNKIPGDILELLVLKKNGEEKIINLELGINK